MKVKGFTLIELLAVIVILAIIALIAVPIILNIIGSSKKSAVVRSGELYLKAVETAIARENLNNQFNPTTCVIGTDGNLTCDGDKTLTIEVNGSKPTSGTITLEKGKIKEVTDMTLTGFELEKKPGEKLKIKGTSSPEESIELNEPTYAIDTTERAPQKTVTITYPEIEGKNLVYEYSIDNGTSWQTATQSQQVKFTAPGSVIARVSYKTNTITAKSFPVTNIGEVLNPQGTYLKQSNKEYEYEETTFLGGTIDRSTIETIIVTNTNQVPSGVIGSWDVSAVQDKSIMAWYVDTNNNNLYELYIGGEGGVKANPNSTYLFCDFSNLANIDLNYLDTSNVTNMAAMFAYDVNLNTLDVSNLDTSQVINMNSMFAKNRNLITLDVSNFDTSKVISMHNMFGTTSGLITTTINNNSKLERIIGLNNFKTSNVTSMGYMFAGCNNLITLDVSSFDTNKVTDMNSMFNTCNNLVSLNLDNFNTSNVTNMSYMFSSCNKLTSLDLNNLDTTNVTKMKFMFYGCNELTNLNLNKFNTSNVIDMSYMFAYCNKLTRLDLSNFVTNKVTDMSYMFEDCNSLTSLNMRNSVFDSVKTTSYIFMFKNTPNLTTIYVKDSSAQTWINTRLSEESKTGVTVTIA